MKLGYTLQAQEVLDVAAETAGSMKHKFIGTEHLLYALITYPSGTAYKVLAENGADAKIVKEYLNRIKDFGQGKAKDTLYSGKLRQVLDNAESEAIKQKCSDIGTEQLLISLIKAMDSIAYKLLDSMSVNIQKIFVDTMVSIGKEPQAAKKEYSSLKNPSGKKKASSATPTLDQYSKDLTREARERNVDPVIGRNAEIERVMQILCRRMKNNPCLVGEPGVGKTAIVEGLAQLIAEENVPEIL
ncbi:MAG: ATP-dependent Clp protease ATP-binding subunit, partial [Lachnospiraceae bacterium]|nr:ATP-dependent Clp protease ATP-binding subunit [Lachnospiraceae bacterium]